MSYTAKDLRNICLLGHGGDGKTALAESMLFVTKGTDRLGKSADGNTISDFDQEEIKRGYSISTSVIPVEYKGTKINVLDNPGYFDFAGEVAQSLRVSDAGVILCTAKSGIEVGTEKAWKYLRDAELPAFFYVSKLDEEHADYFATVDALREKFGITVIPFVYPAGDGVKCVLDQADEHGEEYYALLTEAVAETSEELMEKFFMEEPFTAEEMAAGIREGIRTRVIMPVFCGCAMNGLGTEDFIKGICDYAPNPLEGKPMPAEEGDFTITPDGSPMAFIFKTVNDQFGKNSYFKVISGELNDTLTLVNGRTGDNEKISNMFFPKGKTQNKASSIACGDIGVFTKLSSVKTGDTMGLSGKIESIKAIEYDEPCYTMAVYAKTKGQEDKVNAGLIKLNEEDCSFTLTNNAETKEMIISGVADIHLNVLCAKLLNKYKVECELKPAKIEYRETIRKKVEVHGRHKKQTGGHGQFGDVYIRFEPQSESEDMIFVDETVGGCVPKNFIPSVEKGLRNCVGKGVLAGYPVVNLKATLYFGSYHPVASSDMAFQTAAGIAWKEGLPQASPVLLEPIGSLKVTVPDAYMGDIMSDISKRGGRVMGMNPDAEGNQIVEAEVPMGEMSSYAIDLRSMTQSRGSFTLRFERYEEASSSTQQKVIEEAKKNEE